MSKKFLSTEYLAGLVDGEGCIFIAKRLPANKYQKSPCFTGSIQISMTAKALILRLQKELSGSVSERDHTGTNNKDAWSWHLGGPKALQLLKQLIPYLQVKREQASLVIKLLTRTGRYRGARKGSKGIKALSKKEVAYRQKLCDMCHKLNKRGR